MINNILRYMKKLFLSVMLASAGVASAQTAVTTDVVGYVSLGNVNENEPALPANTDITISIPFIEDTVLSSTVVSSTDDTVVISSDMVSGEFSAQDTPFILVVESGAFSR